MRFDSTLSDRHKETKPSAAPSAPGFSMSAEWCILSHADVMNWQDGVLKSMFVAGLHPSSR